MPKEDGFVWTFPVRGIDRSRPWGAPRQNFTYDCQNVIPYDRTASRRFRGGTRPGVAAVSAAALAGAVQRLHSVPKTDGTTRLFAIGGGRPYDVAVTVSAVTPAAIGGATIVSAVNEIHSADVNGFVYFTDGAARATNRLRVSDATVQAWTIAAGSAPANVGVCCNFNGRLVLQDASSPQNLYFSRALDPTDFDSARTDALAAVDLNASSSAGRIGDPVVALIPLKNGQLLIGCKNAIYLLDGDPLSGGRISEIIRGVGVIHKDAYCISPEGLVYFLATDAFRVYEPATRSVEDISQGRVNHLLTQLTSLLRCGFTFDARRNGAWMFFGSFYLYYSRGFGKDGDGFFPIAFADPNIFYISAAARLPFDADTSHAAMIFGCSQGDNRLFMMSSHDESFEDRDKTTGGFAAIDSYAWIGPSRPYGNKVGLLTRVQFFMGELANGLSTFNCAWTINAAKDESQVFTAPTRSMSGTITAAGRQTPVLKRIRGRVVALKLANAADDKGWSFERAEVRTQPSGLDR